MTRPFWLDALVGTEVRDALEVEVHFPDEAPLTTGDLVLETDAGFMQLVSVAPERRLRGMRDPSDVKLVGDWSDRSGVVLKTKNAIDVPFRIVRVDYVQRGGRTDAPSTMGAWLVGEGLALRVAVLLDADDVEAGPPSKLWDHLIATARNEQEVTIFGAK